MRITCCTCSQSLSTLSAFGNDNHVYKCVTAEQWDGLCIQYGMVYVSFDRVKISYELCQLVLMWQIPSKLSTRQGYEDQNRRFRFCRVTHFRQRIGACPKMPNTKRAQLPRFCFTQTSPCMTSLLVQHTGDSSER